MTQTLLSQKLEFARRYNNFSKKELAQILKISASTYNNFLDKNKSNKILHELCCLYQIEEEIFLNNLIDIFTFEDILYKKNAINMLSKKYCCFCFEKKDIDHLVYYFDKYVCKDCLQEIIKLQKDKL